MPFPGRREDFSSDEAWNHWKTSETTHLSQLILVMIKASPDLAKSMPSDSSYNSSPTAASPVAARPTSLFITSSSTPTSSRPLRGSISGRQSYFGSIDVVAEDVDADDEVPVGHHFTYIPPSPKKYYKRLLEVCLAADLEAMLSDAVNDDDEVSLGILSPAHIELVNECALRWRIGQAFRATCFLELVKQFYERNDVPLECIPEALQTIDRVQTENDVEKWMVSDVSMHSLLLFLKSLRLLSQITSRQSTAPCSTSSFPHYTTRWTTFQTSNRPKLPLICPSYRKSGRVDSSSGLMLTSLRGSQKYTSEYKRLEYTPWKKSTASSLAFIQPTQRSPFFTSRTKLRRPRSSWISGSLSHC